MIARSDPAAQKLRVELQAEIRRVRGMAARRVLMAIRHPKTSDSFTRQAKQMKDDVEEAFRILICVDEPYALTVALDNLKAYNHDD